MSGRSKNPKTLTGIETKVLRRVDLHAIGSKNPKTLTGIETIKGARSKGKSAACSKNPKTLTGIETSLNFDVNASSLKFQKPQNPYRD